MNRNILSLALLLGSIATHAQTAASYTFQQTSGTYTPIVGNTIAVTEDVNTIIDDESFSAAIPFSFAFAGGTYTTVNISANGSVSFGTNDQVDYAAIEGTSTGSGIIAAMNTDLVGAYLTSATYTAGSNTITGLSSTAMFAVGETIIGEYFLDPVEITAITATTITVSAAAFDSGEGGVGAFTGRIATSVSGTSPNQVFTIQWSGFSYYTSGNSLIDFQVKLYEAGGSPTAQKVEVIYGDVETYGFVSEMVQVGLRGMTNADFNDRESGAGWSNTGAGTSASAYVDVETNDVPSSGLTFTWTPGSCIPPDVFIGNDTAICAGDSLILQSNYPFAQNTWSTGSTQPFIKVPAGTYSLTVDPLGDGCTGSDTIVIFEYPPASAGTITTTGASPTFTFTVDGAFAFPWMIDFGDGMTGGFPSPTPTTTTYTYTANGTYTVQVIALGMCGDTDTATTTVTVTGLGINSTTNNAAGLRVFPNPATGSATVSVANGLRINSVEVVDAIGRVAIVQSVKAASGTLNVGSLSAGMYTLRIQTNSGTLFSKLEIAK